MQVKRHCAVKYRMYPNRAQAALIDRTIGCARFIYNQMLETRIGTIRLRVSRAIRLPPSTRTGIRSCVRWTASHCATPN